MRFMKKKQRKKIITMAFVVVGVGALVGLYILPILGASSGGTYF